VRDYSRSVISIADAKQAALYFQHIIPLSTGYEATNKRLRRGGEKDFLVRKDLNLLLPPQFTNNEKFKDQLSRINMSLGLRMFCTQHDTDFMHRAARGLGLPPERLYFGDDLPKAIRVFIRKYGLRDEIVDGPTEFLAGVETAAASADVAFALKDTKLVDLEATDWDHILEFRRDPLAQEKLRRFRLFLFETYLGKSKQYIEDDISKRLEDYHQTITSWGFETRQGVMNSILTSKSLAAALSGSAAALLVVGAVPASLAAMGGVAVEIGKITLQLRKRHNDLRNMLRENPFTFVDYAREKLIREVK
jgi:hypothetical protein